MNFIFFNSILFDETVAVRRTS